METHSVQCPNCLSAVMSFPDEWKKVVQFSGEPRIKFIHSSIQALNTVYIQKQTTKLSVFIRNFGDTGKNSESFSRHIFNNQHWRRKFLKSNTDDTRVTEMLQSKDKKISLF